MKKLLTFFTFSLVFFSITKAQYVAIPDSGLRVMLRGLYPSCFNANGEMDTTCDLILQEDSLNVGLFADNSQPVSNLDGIQYFKSLVIFNCVNCWDVNTIPPLAPTLKKLYCSGMWALQNVPPFPPSLEVLDISNCARLRTVPSFPATLKWLYCGYSNQFDSLPALPNGLIYLDMSQCLTPTNFTSLPDSLRYLITSYNEYVRHLPPLPPKLKRLDCAHNFIDTLYAPLPDSLEYMDLTFNYSITSLPELPPGLKELYVKIMSLNSLPALPASLQKLDCSGNYIRELPTLNNGLTDLNCSNNYLRNLPALPLSLKNLDCSSDSLTSLPFLYQGLKIINCKSNLLTELPVLPASLSSFDCRKNNIYCLPRIPVTPNYFSLYVDGQKVNCIPNITPQLVLFKDDNSAPTSISLCIPLNNVMHCQTFPVMHGIVFYDNNNNGIKDINEPTSKNVRVNLSNDSYSFSDINGVYEIGTDTTGSYTLTAEPPRYFNYTPVSYNYNFTGYDTLVTGDFALHATSTVNELSIKIIPINWAARPGFPFTYMISYQNTGTTNLLPVVTFNYDSTILMYDSSSVSGIVDNGNSLSFNTGSLQTGQDGNFAAHFTLKTTASLGDSLRSAAIISAGTYQATDSNTIVIRGAFDPNDKQATPRLSPLQVSNGEYIDYTIRFQNTGTDTAFNIVISDTLNSDLQAETLHMIAASHSCKASVKDNIVLFEFLNILLPDSNINESKSHGFVSFRIRPQTNVAVNTIIPNRAAIYFDYNAPVITNTAGTLIKDFTPVPLKLVSFSVVLQNDNTTLLYWNTVNEVNTQKFTIQRSNDGLNFDELTNIMAKGRASNNYAVSVTDISTGIVFYRLKMIDTDGSFTYSPIIRIDRRKNTAGTSILSNPVKDFIVINTTDRALNNTQASIINIQGSVVKTFILKEGSQQIEIKDLPVGIYYLRSINGSQKILVQ